MWYAPGTRDSSAWNDCISEGYHAEALQRRSAAPRARTLGSSTVTMLLSLCLLVLRLHASASGAFGVPSEHVTPARWGGAPTRAAIETAAVVSAREDGSSRAEWWRHAARRSFALAPSRVAQPFTVELEAHSPATRWHTPTADVARSPHATNAAVHISLRVRALDSSRESGERGALLAYYPTAPPLQG